MEQFKKTNDGWEYFTREDMANDAGVIDRFWCAEEDGGYIFYDIENETYYIGERPAQVTGPLARYYMPLEKINDFFIFCKEQIDEEAIESFNEEYANDIFFIDMIDHGIEEYCLWDLETIRDNLPTLDEAFGDYADTIGQSKADELMGWYEGDMISLLYDNWSSDTMYSMSVTRFPQFKEN